jgi:nucleotide-binding universal stress UspA family protein
VVAQRRIVVGVDGSKCSEIALTWAADEAEHRGATLVAVTTWTALPPPIVYPYAGFPDRDPGDPREAAMSALGELVVRVLQDRPNLSVKLLAIPGDTAKVLIEQSRDADLVVVGARGTGGVTDWLLGSVSHSRPARLLQRCSHTLTADGASRVGVAGAVMTSRRTTRESAWTVSSFSAMRMRICCSVEVGSRRRSAAASPPLVEPLDALSWRSDVKGTHCPLIVVPPEPHAGRSSISSN